MKPKQIYLLGAGFTKSIFPDAPDNKALLDVLTKYWKTDVFSKYKEKYHGMSGEIKDIEKLLTYMDMDIENEDFFDPKPKTQIQQDRMEINEAIATFFQRFRFKEEEFDKNTWLRNFSMEILQEHDVIINLNYECFLEGMLDFLNLWEPINGYVGVHFHTEDKTFATEDKHIKLIKPHGSENFKISSCYPNKDMKSIGSLFDVKIFPNSARYSHLGGGALDPKSYIIAPSFIKSPHVQITDMMLKAINAAHVSNTLVIIGCGLRKEDLFIKYFLTSFLNAKRKTKKKIIIVDPNAAELRDKISLFWGQNLKHYFKVYLFEGFFQDSIPFLCKIILNKKCRTSSI